jgi:hypothetical protein
MWPFKRLKSRVCVFVSIALLDHSSCNLALMSLMIRVDYYSAIKSGETREMVCFGRGSEGQTQVGTLAKVTQYILYLCFRECCTAHGSMLTVSVPTRAPAFNHGLGKVPIPGGWTHISAGWKHTCGLQTDLSLHCWGDNRYSNMREVKHDTQRLHSTCLSSKPSQ